MPQRLSPIAGNSCGFGVINGGFCWLLAFAMGCGTQGQELSPPSAASKTLRTNSGKLATHAEMPRKADVPLDLGGVNFEDVAARAGLTYVWPQQPRPMRTVEAFGCGCAAFDFDNDGWQDILLVADPHPILYRNMRNATFLDVTESCGLKLTDDSNWIGCAIGDYNGDGWLDVLLTGFHRLALYQNVSGSRFKDVTINAGLDSQNHQHWGAGAGFMDLDGDAWLDLVILDYVQFDEHSKQYCELENGVKISCPPKEYPPERGEIWRNNGNGGFELIPGSQGMDSTNGVGLVLAFADLDDDGRMDFYIGNDARPADLMHNLGGMRFDNIAVESGLAFDRNLKSLAAMGADWGDYDRDGKLDLTISNFQELSFVLFRQSDVNSFSDVSKSVGITQATYHRLGFGLNWLDFDNDGWPDIAYVNGHVHENAEDTGVVAATYRQPLMLMRNLGGKKFADLIPGLASVIARPMVGRGSATLDFDNDGKMDFLVVDYEGPVMLLHNRSQTKNHWIMFDLEGAGPNRFAYGAQVSAKSGEQIWKAQVSPSSSYLSSEDPRVHLGLGSVERLDTVTIFWPSGVEQTLHNVATDQIHQIEEPMSRLAPASP